jgi:nickel-dependent lactate racemase
VEAAKRVGLKFIINVVLNDQRQMVAVTAGEPQATHAALVDIARSLFTVPIPQPFDVVVAGVGYPKDANLYQATRASSYLVFAPQPVVRQGGLVILPARAEEGPGQGVGEQRFYHTLKNATSMADLIADAREHGYAPGEQRSFYMAKTIEHCDTIVVGAECPDCVQELHMLCAADMNEAFALARERLGAQLNVLVVPHALLTLPVVQG